VSNNKKLVIEVNHIDHLVIKYKRENTSLKEVLDKLKILNDVIEGLVTFAFDSKIGYIRSQPWKLHEIDFEVCMEFEHLKVADDKEVGAISQKYQVKLSQTEKLVNLHTNSIVGQSQQKRINDLVNCVSDLI
jgi:hypothetical protein